MIYTLRTTILTLLFFWATHPFTYTQERPNTDWMQQDLAKANAFIEAYRNDTARIVVAQLMEVVKKENQLDSPFGLTVQLAQGTALDHDDHDSLAMQILLHVKERSREKLLWDLFTKSCIALALLHESMERRSHSFENLQQAQYAISHYGQDALYPAFAVRMSSYYRVFTENKDSAMFYAQEALRTAPQFKSDMAEATAHMLMLLLLRKTSYEKELEHGFAGLRVYQKLKVYAVSAIMYNNISRVYYDYNKIQLALAFNDSTIIDVNKAVAEGYERTNIHYTVYQFRGNLLKSLGQTDSAWFYLNKGNAMELDWVKKTENYKVAEVDARYNDEKRITQIAKQTQQRNGILIISLLILLFAAALSYYYLKLRKANEMTQKQEAQLRTLDVAKTRFFANISHELRTPLTLILGPLSILLKNARLDNAALTNAQLAHTNAQNLLKLVNEILDLSKLESGKMKVQETTVRFQPFISRLVSAFESHAEYLGIHYQLEYKAAERLRLCIDAEKLTQIVNNLLSNALKFTPRGGSISVKIEDFSNVLRLTVSDTGRGIHPDDLPHVFNRFYQTNQADAPIEGGTGIGLALCRELADVMGGRIWVESEYGKGSQFYVEFPKKEVLGVGEEDVDLQNLLPSTRDVNLVPFVPNTEENVVTGLGSLQGLLSLPSNPSTKTILIVEDNHDLRTYIADILRGSNYQVLETKNGLEALDLLQELEAKQQLPQLILSDIMMPVMDGFQLLKVLKDRPFFQQIPVVMLTARADIRDKLTALRIGVDDYLLKPFDEEELIVRIENLLKNKAVREKEVLSDIEEPEKPTPLISEPDRMWLENFEQYVQKNFASDVLSVSMLAEAFYMSESTLLRQLKRLTGLTPVQYLQEIRLNEARHLLENRQYDSITQVASKVGYADTRSFSRSFKQRFGKLPSDLF